MYLLGSTDDLSAAPVSLLKGPWPSGNRVLQEVESDYLEPIRELESLFSGDPASLIWPLVSSESIAHSEHNWALGAATLWRRSHSELLDGFSRNYIREIFSQNFELDGAAITLSVLKPRRNLLGTRRRESSLSLQNALFTVSNSYEWDDFPSSSSGDQRLLEFEVRGGKIKGKAILRFTGDLVGKGLSKVTRAISGYNLPVTALSKIELIGKDTEYGYWIHSAQRELAKVIPDFNRRTELAAAYEVAPTAIGMPAQLRAEIKRGLNSLGIAPGDYSRIGFSAGRFPNTETLVPVRGSDTEMIFERCSYCRDVQSLSFAMPSSQQFEVARDLTALNIDPWHRSICNDPSSLSKARPPLIGFRTPEEIDFREIIAMMDLNQQRL